METENLYVFFCLFVKAGFKGGAFMLTASGLQQKLHKLLLAGCKNVELDEMSLIWVCDVTELGKFGQHTGFSGGFKQSGGVMLCQCF